MKTYYLWLLILFAATTATADVLPEERLTDWSTAGLTHEIEYTDVIVTTDQLNPDGFTKNDEALNNIIDQYEGTPVRIILPEGKFMFHGGFQLSSNICIRGQGADATELIFDHTGLGPSFSMKGSYDRMSLSLTENGVRGSNKIVLHSAFDIEPGDWIQIWIRHPMVTSEWATWAVSQIAQIEDIVDDTVFLESVLRADFPVENTSYVTKINTIENVFIECLKITRLDDTDPNQISNFYFGYAVNCGIRGVESENCNFAHVEARSCSNLEIVDSYFHHALGYGGGGRGYGVMLHFGTGEVLVQNNIFEHLRHSMIVQAGANGNVFAYNYSLDPYWEETALPSNSAGDIVLHGNWVYGNLFEGNICQNIVIDNSHGANGPYNTFFRNRAELWGIFFSAGSSPEQNIIGNEVTETELPYSLANYFIQGDGHLLYANYNKGTLVPEDSDELPLKSLFYTEKPNFLDEADFGGIGYPNTPGSGSIPAERRYKDGDIFRNICGYDYYGVEEDFPQNNLDIAPVPADDYIDLSIRGIAFGAVFSDIKIFNLRGEEMPLQIQSKTSDKYIINTADFPEGVYILQIGKYSKSFVVSR